MQELQKTHDNLTIGEKNKLFRQILNNLGCLYYWMKKINTKRDNR